MRNLAFIPTFLLVAKHKSFKEVAKALHITATAVSKQIKALEAEIGEQLFLRTTRKVELTEFGESFYQHCLELNNKIDAVDEFIASKKSVPQGKLQILCSLTTGQEALLKYLPEFSRLYPKIEYEIEFSENTTGVAFEYGDVHFAYAEHKGVTDDLRYRHIFTVQHMLCVAPKYLNTSTPINNVADLLKHKFINLDIRDPIDGFRLENGDYVKMPQPYLCMNSFTALMQACVNGMGIMLTANRFAEPYLKSGKLVQVLPNLDYRCLDIYIFYRAMKYELPKVKAFVDFYTQKLQGYVYVTS